MMNRKNRVRPLLFGACFALCACNADLTASQLTASAAIRRDNGMGYGSGNRSDANTAVTSVEATADTATARNGMGYGSGN